MTSQFSFSRIRTQVVPAVVTALLFAGTLWVQHARGGWPFATPRAASITRSEGLPSPSRADSATSHDRISVTLSGDSTQRLGIRLDVVGRQRLTEEIRAVAIVAPDESRIAHAHTRVAGWVEQLDVNTTGEVVRVGQPIARIFSQELLSSQTEYLAARKYTAASGISSAVLASGRTRLTVLGMTAEEIDAIEQSGEPRRLVTVVAPTSGVVVNRGVTVGTSVDPSTTLLTIADLSRVWVFAEVPEANIPGVRLGTEAQLDFPAAGRPPFSARVDFLYPTLTERTRTLRVRFSTANTGGTLRPGLYGTALFRSAGTAVITVPRDAVVDTGRQQHVFVAVGDRFEPRAITLGLQLADRVEVRSGLTEGERIVSSGVFLLDSESRLRATGGGGGHQHGTPSSGQAPTAPQVEHGAPEPSADPHAGHGR